MPISFENVSPGAVSVTRNASEPSREGSAHVVFDGVFSAGDEITVTINGVDHTLIIKRDGTTALDASRRFIYMMRHSAVPLSFSGFPQGSQHSAVMEIWSSGPAVTVTKATCQR